jgi:hemolysin activation/secretion protein
MVEFPSFRNNKLLFLWLLGIFLNAPSFALAADAVSAVPAVPATPEADQAMLRFTISQYVVEGASLLSQREIDAAVAPYVGKDKDFSDVQRALEAVEDAYAKRGYSTVRVLLPEQELEKGTVRFRVMESRFGKVTVRDNHFVSEANALNAVPSVRSGGVPRTRQIARELKLANENPARQMNVVLKAGAIDDEVDANVIVTDSKPSIWGVSIDNSGTSETGDTRLGFSYLNANAFNADHVAGIQYLTSPQYPDRVEVLGGSYKIPLYRSGNSLEFFGGYSNVNSVVGGLSNFQGGGRLFSTRYNHPLERMGVFDPRLSLGLDWRDFRRIEMTNPQSIIYNEIVVMPVSLTYAAQGKLAKSDINFNVSLSRNLSGMNKGHREDFAAYDVLNSTQPNDNYRVLRYGADYSRLMGEGWQFRTALTGQWSSDVLVQGEQMRLGGADAVRGFSEGSEGGEKAARLNLEEYTPDFGKGDVRARALIFFDAGEAKSATNGTKVSISGAGVGLRAGFTEQYFLRSDVARIMKAGTDPAQQVGKWRAHLSLNATF